MVLSVYERKLNNRIAEFSGHLMNDSKWTKIFWLIGRKELHVKRVQIVTVWNDVNQKGNIMSHEKLADFEGTFFTQGIRDILTGGPVYFKEILKIRIDSDNIGNVEKSIDAIGQFEKDNAEGQLTIFGYK
jgi:hypothetical protein